MCTTIFIALSSLKSEIKHKRWLFLFFLIPFYMMVFFAFKKLQLYFYLLKWIDVRNFTIHDYVYI